MTTTRLNELTIAANAAVEEARGVAQKAFDAGRSMTDSEASIHAGAMAKGLSLLEDIKGEKANLAILGAAKSLADEIGIPTAADPASAPVADVKTRVKSLGLQVVESAAFKAIAPSAGSFIPSGARVQSSPIAIKSVLTGADRTSAGAFVVPEQTGIVEMLGRRPLKIRDMISVRTTGSDSVEYVRQVSHVNAAAFVPESASAGTVTKNLANGYKPEASFSFERDVATVKTVAEWVPATKRALSDVASLAGLINDELSTDLDEKEEDGLVDGDGVGDNLLGMLRTPGTQSQAFDTDRFTTIRRALTKVRVIGRTVATAVGMSPVDLEEFDLARNAAGDFYSGGPFSTNARTVWGVPIVESEAFHVGQAVVGDFSKMVLWDREQTSVTVSDSHEDFFIRNLVAILAEKREAAALVRPSALVLTDLTPGA